MSSRTRQAKLLLLVSAATASSGLGGTIACTTTATATLAKTDRLAGVVAGTTSPSGTLPSYQALGGTVALSSTLAAPLAHTVRLGGTTAGATTGSAAFLGSVALGGTVSGGAAGRGWLRGLNLISVTAVTRSNWGDSVTVPFIPANAWVLLVLSTDNTVPPWSTPNPVNSANLPAASWQTAYSGSGSPHFRAVANAVIQNGANDLVNEVISYTGVTIENHVLAVYVFTGCDPLAAGSGYVLSSGTSSSGTAGSQRGFEVQAFSAGEILTAGAWTPSANNVEAGDTGAGQVVQHLELVPGAGYTDGGSWAGSYGTNFLRLLQFAMELEFNRLLAGTAAGTTTPSGALSVAPLSLTLISEGVENATFATYNSSPISNVGAGTVLVGLGAIYQGTISNPAHSGLSSEGGPSGWTKIRGANWGTSPWGGISAGWKLTAQAYTNLSALFNYTGGLSNGASAYAFIGASTTAPAADLTTKSFTSDASGNASVAVTGCTEGSYLLLIAMPTWSTVPTEQPTAGSGTSMLRANIASDHIIHARSTDVVTEGTNYLNFANCGANRTWQYVVVEILPAVASKRLAGSIAGTTTLSGSMLTPVDLVGDVVPGITTPAAALAVTKPLGGSIAGTTSAAAPLANTVQPAGSIAASSAVAAPLAVTKTLGGSVAGTNAPIGDLAHTATLAATVVGTTALTGPLTTAGAADLVGTVAGSCQPVATLALGVPLGTASVSGATTLYGALATSLRGAVAGATTLSGRVDTSLRASVAGSSSLAGNLLVSLRGSVAGSTALSAPLSTISSTLEAYVSGNTSLTATLATGNTVAVAGSIVCYSFAIGKLWEREFQRRPVPVRIRHASPMCPGVRGGPCICAGWRAWKFSKK